MSTSVLAGAATQASERSSWRRFPTTYEINTWIWLSELSVKARKSVDLSCVPPDEWDVIAANGFDSVWLMGVWERSPAGIAIANRNRGLLDDFRRALSDFRGEDNVGSPYCVRRYEVDARLGGREGLAIARRELSKRGMNLILDFVPNHVAPDHPWVESHPEYFIRGNEEDARRDPASFLESAGAMYACGRDPYFPAWPDVLQLNAFASGLRQAAIDTVSEIARQCDGVRCDMAMLFLTAVFERTWGARAGDSPATEYWKDLISAIKAKHPGFLFIAEAYWDLEWELQQLGFDFCYDKKLYDRLEHSTAENIRLHLCADMGYQEKLVRFIENHDEPRAAASFSIARQKSAALTIGTLPGMRLFHEGQFEGRKVRPPVFLGRRPEEAVNAELQEFYRELLNVVRRPAFHDGQWRLCERTGWPDNSSFQDILAWEWEQEHDHYLIVVNLSNRPAQAMVHTGCAAPELGTWLLFDPFTAVSYERDGAQIVSQGLYVDLPPWGYHFFECLPHSLQETHMYSGNATEAADAFGGHQ